MTYDQLIAHIRQTLTAQNLYTLKRIEKRKYKEGSYDLFSVQRNKRLAARPTVCIVATLHGEEPAGAVACAEHLHSFLETANEHRVNLVVVPCANPYGFDRGVRETPVSEFMNGGFIHPELEKPSAEVKRLRTFLLKTRAEYYLDLHEDYESHGAYLYAFKDRLIAKKVLQAATRQIAIEEAPRMDDPDILDANIQNGIVFEAHDSTSEDLMSHQHWCRFSAALETPSSFFPIDVRAEAHAEAVCELIRIASRHHAGGAERKPIRSKLLHLTRMFWTR